MIEILFSAPYMIPVFSRFESEFARRDIRVIIPEVSERLSESELMKYAGKIDGAICGDDGFSASVLKASSPRLKVISKWGTGIDSIDQEAADRLGIKVFNTPRAFTDPVADSVMAYVLIFARRTIDLDRSMKSGEWTKLPGFSLREQTLGVVGVGDVGKAVLRRAHSFGMTLLGNDIVTIDPEFIEEFDIRMVSLPSLLQQSDYVSLNCDLNPTSHHLIDGEKLRLMKPGAYLINTSRGSVVDEEALITALSKQTVAGAGLDVFEDEPPPLNSPLYRMNHVFLAPHNANSSPEAWERVHENTIRNLFIGLGLEEV
jgi:D-3-phosphoglycerate dehydrogenase